MLLCIWKKVSSLKSLSATSKRALNIEKNLKTSLSLQTSLNHKRYKARSRRRIKDKRTLINNLICSLGSIWISYHILYCKISLLNSQCNNKWIEIIKQWIREISLATCLNFKEIFNIPSLNQTSNSEKDKRDMEHQLEEIHTIIKIQIRTSTTTIITTTWYLEIDKIESQNILMIEQILLIKIFKNTKFKVPKRMLLPLLNLILSLLLEDLINQSN